MKNFLLKLSGLGLVMVALFFTACGDDPIIEIPLGPEISFVADPGFLDLDSDVLIGESFSVKVRVSKGDAQLNTLAIDEGSSKLPTTQFTINSGAITSNNPLLITGTDKDGTTYTIDITPNASLAVGDITTYTFTVTDESGETDTRDIVITTTELPGTDITMDISGVLLNQAGMAGTGGLDLDTGTGTGSANASAEIRDMGIDCSLPNASNWRRLMGATNGSVLRGVDVTQLENFTFDNVTKVESIIEAYTSGDSYGTGQTDNCVAATTVQHVIGVVAVGDMFTVFANDTYYLIRVDAVNNTNNNNMDSYELSIKY
jgi:hypothetical protein